MKPSEKYKIKWSRLLSIARFIMGVSLTFWLLETAYFGFNLHAMSYAEVICDKIVNYGVLLGTFIYLIPLVALYTDAVDKMDKKEN